MIVTSRNLTKVDPDSAMANLVSRLWALMFNSAEFSKVVNILLEFLEQDDSENSCTCTNEVIRERPPMCRNATFNSPVAQNFIIERNLAL